jgi:hypothetical protein
MDRLNLSASGLPAEQFAAAHITLGQITRKALLLPSPGRADFSLELPAEATLRMGAGIARVPGLPDTASAGIELHVNGEPVWSRELDQDEDWQTVEIDLKRWAGKSVQLSLRSTELGEAHGDWVALAEPEILGPPTGQGPRRILVLGIDTLGLRVCLGSRAPNPAQLSNGQHRTLAHPGTECTLPGRDAR